MNTLFVVWDPNHATGIPIIDEHNRSIISRINSLFYFMRTKQGKTAVVPTVTILEQYVKLHFHAEEKLLKEAQYNEFDRHVGQHIHIMKEMHLLAVRLRRSNDPVPLLDFLKFWWKDHIEVQDRAYSKHITAYLKQRDSECSGPAERLHAVPVFDLQWGF